MVPGSGKRKRKKKKSASSFSRPKQNTNGSVARWHSLLLGELSSNLVGQDFVPVQLVAGDGQGTTKGLEGGVGELGVALVDGSLVLDFSLLHSLHNVAGELLQAGRKKNKRKEAKVQNNVTAISGWARNEEEGGKDRTFPLPEAVTSTVFSVVSCTLPSS